MGFWKTGHQRVLKSCIIYCWVFLYQVSMVMGSAGTEKRVWVCLVLGDVFVPWPKILLEVYARLEPQATIIYFDVAILLLLLTWRFGQSHWLWGSQLLKIESMVLPPAHQPFTGNHKYWKMTAQRLSFQASFNFTLNLLLLTTSAEERTWKSWKQPGLDESLKKGIINTTSTPVH